MERMSTRPEDDVNPSDNASLEVDVAGECIIHSVARYSLRPYRSIALSSKDRSPAKASEPKESKAPGSKSLMELS